MNDLRRILLVDDNFQYRSAVQRNLTLAGYEVVEAEDSSEGLEKIRQHPPHVIITDLDMRSHDEGLQFIRETKRLYPAMPMIMISSVGTFDEGALARQYGAMLVLSKSRMDAEIDTLYEGLDRIFSYLGAFHRLRDRLDTIDDPESDEANAARAELEQLLSNQELDAGLKSQVFELLERIQPNQKTQPVSDSSTTEEAVASLRKDLASFDALDAETQTMLSVAEGMQMSDSSGTLSVARNISFSYSFAVENEVKLRVGRRVNRLFTAENVKALADQLYDPALNNLDIFFNQYLIRLVQQHNLEMNSDITRQVLERILKHGDKYKPDGLKALGVILFCWGRSHEFANRRGKISISNPLGMKGLDDDETTRLASQLIRLQHLRNPFIHPEFSEREKTESLRTTALACLSRISQVK